MKDIIIDHLKYFEKFDALPQVSMKILFACESGSRAWGFESKDSDYDVRFIYMSPLRWYISRRDVFENDNAKQLLPDMDPNLDFSGWDLYKFFSLMQKSNPVIFEWLASDTVYKEIPGWKRVRKLAPHFFNPKSAMHHYGSMARHNFREHMLSNPEEVKLKKYLYITRPLLCCHWIMRSGKPPPMRIQDLIILGLDINPDVLEQISSLVDRKKAGDELGTGKTIPILNQFIESELAQLNTYIDTIPVRDKSSANPELWQELFQDFCGSI